MLLLVVPCTSLVHVRTGPARQQGAHSMSCRSSRIADTVLSSAGRHIPQPCFRFSLLIVGNTVPYFRASCVRNTSSPPRHRGAQLARCSPAPPQIVRGPSGRADDLRTKAQCHLFLRSRLHVQQEIAWLSCSNERSSCPSGAHSAVHLEGGRQAP